MKAATFKPNDYSLIVIICNEKESTIYYNDIIEILATTDMQVLKRRAQRLYESGINIYNAA